MSAKWLLRRSLGRTDKVCRIRQPQSRAGQTTVTPRMVRVASTASSRDHAGAPVPAVSTPLTKYLAPHAFTGRVSADETPRVLRSRLW